MHQKIRQLKHMGVLSLLRIWILNKKTVYWKHKWALPVYVLSAKFSWASEHVLNGPTVQIFVHPSFKILNLSFSFRFKIKNQNGEQMRASLCGIWTFHIASPRASRPVVLNLSLARFWEWISNDIVHHCCCHAHVSHDLCHDYYVYIFLGKVIGTVSHIVEGMRVLMIQNLAVADPTCPCSFSQPHVTASVNWTGMG